ncbi:MAG: hypothetical protein FWD35_06335, partial [Oscillospiraceae bacterium]|nr:hypothetical protein [Oscillospiraceae bacterium]
YERSVFGAIHRAVKNALLNAQQLDETQIRSAAEPIRKAPEIALRAAPSPFAEGAAFEYKYINPEEYVREIPVQEQFPNSKTTEQGSIAIWGELFSTYVVCEQSGNLVLIDKHAAHERLEFERLKAQWKAHSQLLLEPVEIGEEQLGAHSIGELLENAPQLAKIGVIIERAESDKEEKLFITAFPTLLRTSSAQQLLCEVAQSLAKGGNAEFCSLIDEALHRVACHAAIKAGDKSDALDIRLLAERVLNDTTGQLRHCPHGRPIVVEITKQELEKRFRRVL